MTEPDIVLLAHGSPDPRHAHNVDVLAGHVRALVPSRPVHTAYLDHHAPSPADAAALIGSRAVVVPVLLTPAHHARVDVPAAVDLIAARSGSSIELALPLGPHPFLLDAAEELLLAHGVAPDPRTAVLLYAAGSSDTDAVASVTHIVQAAPRPGWGRWDLAALDGGATLEQVLRRLPEDTERTVVVSFMVAEGILRDRMAQECGRCGVTMVPGALAQTEALAHLVLERADSVPA